MDTMGQALNNAEKSHWLRAGRYVCCTTYGLKSQSC